MNLGDYVYRIKSPNGTYPPVDTLFKIDPEVSNQSFFGTVSDPEGNPIPGAFVAALNPLGDGNQFVFGESTDENGTYTLHTAPNEEYDLVAAAPGYVGAYGKNVSHFILENDAIEVGITLLPATRTISGLVHDVSDPTIALPGVEVVLLSVDGDGLIDQNFFTVTWSDGDGHFEAGVTEGRWVAIVRRNVIYNRGYMATHSELSDLPMADTTAGDVANLDIGLTRGQSVIHGRLTSSKTDEFGEKIPLTGVVLSAIQHPFGAASHGVTDGDGYYRIIVTEGYWNVYAVPYSLQEEGHTTPQIREIKVGPNPSSIEHNITARPNEAEATGFFTDQNDEPISKLLMGAINMDDGVNEFVARNSDETDGFFSFGLSSGEWMLVPDALEAARRQLLFAGFPSVSVAPLAEGAAPPEIDAVFKTVAHTGEIVLTIVDAEGAPVAGIRAYGATLVGGEIYHSFGVSDATGKLHMAGIDGLWKIYLTGFYLQGKGFTEVPEFELNVAGAMTEFTVPVSVFAGSEPNLLVNTDDVLFWAGTGEAGQRYVIEGSENLADWREVGRVIAEGGAFSLIPDEDTAKLDKLFMRIRLALDAE